MEITTTGPARWTHHSLDKFVAPNISKFNSAEIKDLTESYTEAGHWWANLTLYAVIGGGYSAELQQAILGILRRTGSAFAAYHRARAITLEYIAKTLEGEQPLRKFYAAVDEWEMFILQAQMAMALLVWVGDEKLFQRGDGSIEERLYTIANNIKHMDSCISSNQCTQHDTIPLWLSNNGLESFGLTLSFDETAELLAKLANTANELQNPLKLREQLAT